MKPISTSAFTLELQDHSEGEVSLALHGELDMTVAIEALELLVRELSNGHDVRIDLSGVEFVDSSGLVVLLRSREHAEAVGRALRITGPLQGQVRRVLRLSQLESRLLDDPPASPAPALDRGRRGGDQHPVAAEVRVEPQAGSADPMS